MDFFNVIDSRSSASRLSEPAPTGGHLTRLIEAAVRAPDHGHLAPWRFIILQGAARDAFADTVAEARLLRTPQATAEQLEADRVKIRRAPMIIVTACVPQLNHPKIPEIEQILAVGAAVENLLLSAHELGYGAVWKTGPAAYDVNVKAALGLQATDHIIAMVHIGTAVVRAPARPPQLNGVVTHL